MTQRVLYAASIAVLTGFVGCGEPGLAGRSFAPLDPQPEARVAPRR